MHSFLIDALLMMLGFAGFTLAFYIYHHKLHDKPLVCPLETKCDLVTHSTYSKFLDIPVEVLGMLYYAAIIILHGFVIAFPSIFSVSVARISLAMSTAAFLFSLYLISVQAFVLKQWCTWCLCSAILCATIFLLTSFAAPLGVF